MDLVDVLRRNVRMRLAQLGVTFAVLAAEYGENDRSVAGWLRVGNPTLSSIEKLGQMLGVPAHALLSPDFNPNDWPVEVAPAVGQ